MDRNHQIAEWYRSLQYVSKDDKADFEVMLLDLKNPADASAAIMGIAMNIMENGLRTDITRLLFDAAKKENADIVQMQSITHILSLYWLHDDEIRQDRDLQEMLLDLLAEHPGEISKYLRVLCKVRKRLNQLDQIKDIKSTLLYELSVVGAKEQENFESI